MPHWSTAEWATVVSAAAAAVAAIAAAVSATISLVVQRRTRVPHVSGGITQNTTTGALGATFANAGPGLASQLYYIAMNEDGNRCGGAIGDGHLQAGERRTFPLRLAAAKSPDYKVYMAWTCRDIDNNIHQWSADWRYKRVSRRRFMRRKDKTLGALFREMYPDVAMPERRSTADALELGSK